MVTKKETNKEKKEEEQKKKFIEKSKENDKIISEISKELIEEINKSSKTKIAYSLGFEESPTDIKEFISTGSTLLDYAIANKKGGGVPVGRLTEIVGEESCITGRSAIRVSTDGDVKKIVKIVDIKEMLENGRSVCVDSPYGFIPVKRFVEKGKLHAIKVVVKDKRFIECTGDHLLFCENENEVGWVCAKDLDISDKISTVTGPQKIISIESIGKHEIYDIEVDHEEHCYWANGIKNHNTGKSLLAIELLKSTQKKGGIGVLLDTENATSPELLKRLGINLKGFVYAQPNHIEDVFSTIEQVIKKIRTIGKNKPVTIVWDSVAGTPTKAELDGEHDDKFMAAAAKVIAQSLRKITQMIGSEKVTMVFTNQLKSKIGVVYGDSMVSFGGKAIPYHSSTRIKLLRDGKVLGDKGKDDQIGVGVKAKVIKNKVSIPFKTAGFNIMFNVGIEESEQIFDTLAKAENLTYTINDKECIVNFSASAWSKVVAKDQKGNILLNESFRKKEFKEKIINVYPEMIEELIDQSCVRKLGNPEEFEINPDSYLEVSALADQILEN